MMMAFGTSWKDARDPGALAALPGGSEAQAKEERAISEARDRGDRVSPSEPDAHQAV